VRTQHSSPCELEPTEASGDALELKEEDKAREGARRLTVSSKSSTNSGRTVGLRWEIRTAWRRNLKWREGGKGEEAEGVLIGSGGDRIGQGLNRIEEGREFRLGQSPAGFADQGGRRWRGLTYGAHTSAR
jgi:hypothetical protein